MHLYCQDQSSKISISKTFGLNQPLYSIQCILRRKIPEKKSLYISVNFIEFFGVFKKIKKFLKNCSGITKAF